MLARETLRAAEERKVGLLEGIRSDSLDEGGLIAHLIQLPLRVLFVEQGKLGIRKRRLGKNILQLTA
jgi:hypothetical protein